MPSSLTMVPPIASVCSTRPPVSVLVRAPRALLRGFSGKRGLPASPDGFVSRLGLSAGGFACPAAYMLSRGRPEPRLRTLLRRPFGHKRSRGGTGMSACCASATPSGLALAPD